METEKNRSQTETTHNDGKKQVNVSSPAAKPDPKPGSGETMRDSMTETAANNDNTKIPDAEQLTDEHGKLDAEAFKRSYQGDKGGRSERK